jgi:hypothetical protein
MHAYGDSTCTPPGGSWCIEGPDYTKGTDCGVVSNLSFPAQQCYWLTPENANKTIVRKVVLIKSSNPHPNNQAYQELLSREFRNSLLNASHGLVDYQITAVYSANYTASDGSDNARIISDFSLCQPISRGDVNEIWVWDAEVDEYSMKIPGDNPYKYDSRCNSRAAYWFYRPRNIPDCGKTVWFHGFDSGRGLGEMLEDYGHRTEGILSIYLDNCDWSLTSTGDWSKFTRINRDSPNGAQCGTVHEGPNSVSGYEWGNLTFVPSACSDWKTYPTLPGNYESVNCMQWGCGAGVDTMAAHHSWWLSMLPHFDGKTNGKLNNWWKYIADVDGALAETNISTS